jgi:CheY-like chemotaxis protein
MDQTNVLIVDDDEPTVDAYSQCLAGAGLACRSALNGWDALELISGGFHPAVVLSDLRMPELDGIGFAQQIGQYMARSPALIFVSGNAGLEDAVHAIRLGAIDFLAKPLDCDALVRAVKSSIIRKSSSPAALNSTAAPALVAPLPQAPAFAATSNPFTARQDALLRLRVVRRIRARVLAPELFADPCWDMLLDLYDAYLSGSRLTVSALADGAGLPLTTTIRRLDLLAANELVLRTPDPSDRRRTFVELSESGVDALARFFENYLAAT